MVALGMHPVGRPPTIWPWRRKAGAKRQAAQQIAQKQDKTTPQWHSRPARQHRRAFIICACDVPPRTRAPDIGVHAPPFKGGGMEWCFPIVAGLAVSVRGSGRS